MNKIQQLQQLETQIQTLISQIIEDVCSDILTTPIKGVVNHGLFFTIQLSTIQQNGLKLSAEYYSPDKQSEYVKHYLSGSSTLKTLQTKINTLITTKKVCYDHNNSYPLNAQTIKILEKHLQQFLH